MGLLSYSDFIFEKKLHLITEENAITIIKNWIGEINTQEHLDSLLEKLNKFLEKKGLTFRKMFIRILFMQLIGMGMINSYMVAKSVDKLHQGETKDLIQKFIKSKPNFKKYFNDAKIYLNRKEFKGTPLTPHILTKAAKVTYIKTGILVPINLVLAQGQIESSLGTNKEHRHPKTNPFSVGEWDNKTVSHFNSTYAGVLSYYNLLANDYLKNKNPKDLVKNFTNNDGKRYSSNLEYEEALQDQIEFVNNYLKKNG